jgi:hypothetical protein
MRRSALPGYNADIAREGVSMLVLFTNATLNQYIVESEKAGLP